MGLPQLSLLLVLLLAVPVHADDLYQKLQSKPFAVPVCTLYSEHEYRDLLAIEGEFFSQSVEQAYRRLADEDATGPGYAGCWWRLSDNTGFVMLQLTLHPAGEEEARRRIDAELEATANVDSPLVPRQIEGLGEAGFWSPLGRRIRWRQGNAVVAELLIAEKRTGQADRLFDARQLEQLMHHAAREIVTRISTRISD